MADLTDDRIADLVRRTAVGWMPNMHAALVELQGYRAAKAADAARIRDVVLDAIIEVAGPCWTHSGRRIRDDAAAKAAEQVVTPAVHFDEEDTAALHWAREFIDVRTFSYDGAAGRMLGLIDSLLAAHGAKP
jgi:hypothetical protein